MSLYCHECGSTEVRVSHLRLVDAVRIIALQYPVRCRNCRHRWYAPLSETRNLPRPQHPRGRSKKRV